MDIATGLLLVVIGFICFDQAIKRIFRSYDTTLNTKIAERLYRYAEENRIPIKNAELGKALHYFYDANAVINHLLDRTERGD